MSFLIETGVRRLRRKTRTFWRRSAQSGQGGWEGEGGSERLDRREDFPTNAARRSGLAKEGGVRDAREKKRSHARGCFRGRRRDAEATGELSRVVRLPHPPNAQAARRTA